MQFFQNLVPSNSTLLLMVVAPAIFSNQPAFFAYQNFFIFHIKPPSQNKRYNLLPVSFAGNDSQYSTQVGQSAKAFCLWADRVRNRFGRLSCIPLPPRWLLWPVATFVMSILKVAEFALPLSHFFTEAFIIAPSQNKIYQLLQVTRL